MNNSESGFEKQIYPSQQLLNQLEPKTEIKHTIKPIVLHHQQSVNTDQLLCNCDCEEIPKLKEKAHKSFMQVVQNIGQLRQIENFYKEEIEQLKQQYEERSMSQHQKYEQRQQFMDQKYKQAQKEVQSIKDQLQKERANELNIEFESPFLPENIDSIAPNFPLDESIQSINSYKELLNCPNYTQATERLHNSISIIIKELKSTLEVKNHPTLSFDEITKVYFKKTLGLSQHLEGQVIKLFELVASVISLAISASDQKNKAVSQLLQSENKNSKLQSLYDSLQKESNFMSEHLKKLSQDKLKAERRCHELQRTNKLLENTVKSLKASLSGNSPQSQTPIQPKESGMKIKIFDEGNSSQSDKGIIEVNPDKKRGSQNQKNGRQIFSKTLRFQKKGSDKHPGSPKT